MELGQSTSIDSCSDLDCSQAYEDKKKKLNYGVKAKEAVQREWVEEYTPNKEQELEPLKLNDQEIANI